MKQRFILLITIATTLSSFAQDKKDLKPRQSFKDCKDCPEMVVTPAGSFMMGSLESELGHYPEESPQRQINVKQFLLQASLILRKNNGLHL